jgi:hypothetical protein
MLFSKHKWNLLLERKEGRLGTSHPVVPGHSFSSPKMVRLDLP